MQSFIAYAGTGVGPVNDRTGQSYRCLLRVRRPVLLRQRKDWASVRRGVLCRSCQFAFDLLSRRTQGLRPGDGLLRAQWFRLAAAGTTFLAMSIRCSTLHCGKHNVGLWLKHRLAGAAHPLQIPFDDPRTLDEALLGGHFPCYIDAMGVDFGRS